jgi:hypothetical protein
MNLNRVSPHPDVVFKNVGGELVLLDFERGIYYGLNEVGSLVWQGLSDGKDHIAIIDELLTEYDVDRDHLERDVEALLRELAANGLVVVEESPNESR